MHKQLHQVLGYTYRVVVGQPAQVGALLRITALGLACFAADPLVPFKLCPSLLGPSASVLGLCLLLQYRGTTCEEHFQKHSSQACGPL